MDEWGETLGSLRKMILPVGVSWGRAYAPTLNVSVKGGNPKYSEAFLTVLLEEHEAEWHSIQRESLDSASRILSEELANLEEKMRSAEEDVIEYQRLHDMARISLRGASERSYLSALVNRRRQLTTELMMLEHQYPILKNQNAVVISDVIRLTRGTGAVEALDEMEEKNGEGGRRDVSQARKLVLPAELSGEQSDDPEIDVRGWQDLKVKLARLRQKARELSGNLKPEHPQIRAVRKDIRRIENQLEVAAQIELERLKDRHEALMIQLNAIESAEYKWQAKHLMVSQRQSELNRIASVVRRFENNHNTLYTRLHNLRVSEELKSDHWRIVEPVATRGRAVWPDPKKILLMVLALGVGSGLGVAMLSQVLDNKVQSIKDVEQEIGVPFLGGVPFWIRSGLEKAIRPIVTEEHASGAIEAYRGLRTNILAALGKINEKAVFVTSADSREGKTLTALNIAILVAQMNKKVVLVDMDLRRGTLHRSLGMEREPGIVEVLRGTHSLKEGIAQTRVENLCLLPRGGTVEHSAELLQSSDLENVLEEMQQDYDYIFIDTSPVLRVTDTVIAATTGVGVVLYVARVNHTPKPLIRYSLDMLKDARVLGLIMNSIEMHKVSSLYYAYQYPNYAYYSNAYAYGYDYYDGVTRRRRRRRRHPPRNGIRRSVEQWFRRVFLPMD